MIKERDDKICPECNGLLKPYDHVTRSVRSGFGNIEHIRIQRYKCVKCKRIHRELPNYLVPYKQFKADIIAGVIDGSVGVQNLEYEDYPCEMTMKRWTKEYTGKK